MSGLFARWQPRYAEHSLATFPVRIEGTDKRPAVRGYLQLGLDLSRQLARQFPANDAFGFALGNRTRITVLDVDTPDSCIACGSTARASASARRSPPRDRLRRRKSAQAELLRTEVPSPGRGIGKAVDPGVASPRCGDHAPLDWLAAPFLMA